MKFLKKFSWSLISVFIYRDLEECNSLDESVENLDRNSLASFGSGNTTDSDKVSGTTVISFWEIDIEIKYCQK